MKAILQDFTAGHITLLLGGIFGIAIPSGGPGRGPKTAKKGKFVVSGGQFQATTFERTAMVRKKIAKS
jgi:hypothetical protein